MQRLLLCIIAVGMAIVTTMDYEDELKQRSYYCEMVELHKSSNGENGWPDYRNIYQTECKS